MPNADISRLRVLPWTPGIKPTWTISEVRNALRSHREGFFERSAMLVESMGEDDELPGLVEKRVDSVLGSDFELCIPEYITNQQLSGKIKKDLEPRWGQCFTDGELGEWLRWYRWLGVSVATLDWTRGPTRWTAKLRTLPPHFLRYQAWNNKWFYNAQGGELEVTPGDGTWLLMVDGPRGYMRASVRSLAITWIAKQLTIRDWNRFNERHGMPIVKAKVPVIADEGDKEDFIEDIKELGNETVAMLPTNLDENGAAFDLELLEATDQSWQSFEKKLARCDRKFQIHWLGQNLTSEIAEKQGSKAAAEVHRGVELAKAKADGSKLGDELREQAILPMAALNFAGVTLDVVPIPSWQTEPSEDTKADADAAKSFGDALTSIKTAGYKVTNVEELAEKYGLELEEQEPPEPPPTPPGQGGPNQPPPPPGKQPPADPGEAKEPPTEEQKASRLKLSKRPKKKPLRLASGEPLKNAPGFVDGQVYADKLTESGAREADKALRPTLMAIAEELEAATDYDDLRARLQRRYATLDEDALTDLVYRGMYLAELAGRAATNQDA
jgi:hypothetical protein